MQHKEYPYLRPYRLVSKSYSWLLNRQWRVKKVLYEDTEVYTLTGFDRERAEFFVRALNIAFTLGATESWARDTMSEKLETTNTRLKGK